MANWRPVEVRVWSDRKFLAGGDDARMLWLFLLTCPSLPIPGVVVGGDAALAEMLGWTPERLRERFAEITRNGLKVRREARIVWLPNALKYQTPKNPNMVKGWAKKWDDVPEGELKSDLWEALRIACKSWSVLFGKLFLKPCDIGIGNGYSNSSGNSSAHDHQHDHQNQHQHDQEDPARTAPPPRQRKEPTGDHGRVVAAFDHRFRERFSQAPTWGPKQGALVKQILAKHPADEVIRRIAILFDSPPAFLLNSAPDIGTLVQHFDKLVQPALAIGTARAPPRPADPRVGRIEPSRPDEYPDGDQAL